MKIWNLNKLTGVLGVFNCQGAGSWPMKTSPQVLHSAKPEDAVITGHVRPLDVEFLDEVAGENWEGDTAVYAFNSGTLSVLQKDKTIQVSLGVLKCEIFTISPVQVLSDKVEFAPIGLIDMYNSGGAIEDIMWIGKDISGTVKIKVKGCGRFGAYSRTKPSFCRVDMKEKEFSYNDENGFLTINLQGECCFRDVEIDY